MAPSVSVILSFYNDLPLLRLVLDALAAQYESQFEVLVADDGSQASVVNDLRQLLAAYPFAATHLWHPDQGFRKTVILNRAVEQSRAPYLVFVDADCVPQDHFIDDHLRGSRLGLCQTGRRVNVAREAVTALDCSEPNRIVTRNLVKLLGWSFSRRSQALEKGLRLPTAWVETLERFAHLPARGILGCNFSLCRQDLLAVNGFDERFATPWGAEDTDLERRLRISGLQFKTLRHQATMIHFDASFHQRGQAGPVGETDYYALVASENWAFTPYGIRKEDGPGGSHATLNEYFVNNR